MAALGCPHLLRRGNTYFFRCRLPVDVGRRLGRAEVVRTLQTPDVLVARLRATILAVRINELWTRLRMAVSPADLERLLTEWFNKEKERFYRPVGSKSWGLANAPDSATSTEVAELNNSILREHDEAMLERAAEDYHAGDYWRGIDVAESICKELGIDIGPGHQLYDAICKKVAQSFGVLYEARLRWVAGDTTFIPTLPGFAHSKQAVEAPRAPEPAPASPPAPGSGGVSLADAIQDHVRLEERQRSLTERQAGQLCSELGVLAEVCGPQTAVGSVTRDDASTIMRALRSLPPRYTTHPQLKGLGLLDRASKARGLGLETLHPRTVNGYLSTMRKFFDGERRNGHITENPFANMTLRVTSKVDDGKDFEPQELATLLTQPIFLGCLKVNRPFDAGATQLDDYRFWVPIIALLTGMRVSEIVQLQPKDVTKLDGVWVFDINRHDGKRTKTNSSVRVVPVHSELVRLGVIRLAEAQRCAGERNLLKALPQPVKGDLGKPVGQWFREKVLVRCNLKRPGLGLHSFRHSFKTGLRVTHSNAELIDRILGHQPERTGGIYGRYPPSALASVVEKLPLPPELAAIQPR